MHLSFAYIHLGANLQPACTLIGLVNSPFNIMRFLSDIIFGTGIAESNACVYGCNWCLNNSFDAHFSTSTPKYITHISLEIWRTMSHPLHERTARQDSSCRHMFETAFLSPHIFIKGIIIAASAAEMTAIPTVPNSHFLPLSLAVM